MRVVVDGNDGTGKTTLVERLRALGHQVCDRGQPTAMTDDGAQVGNDDEFYLLLDVPVEISRSRLAAAGKDLNERYHTIAALTHYRRQFTEVAARLRRAVLIDASGSKDETFARACKAIETFNGNVLTRLLPVDESQPALLVDAKLQQRLERHGLGGLERNEAKQAAMAAAYLARNSVLASIAKRFYDAGQPLLLLKGTAIAQRYWPQPAMRPSCDLDLLVREPVDALFHAEGYQLVNRGPSSQKWKSAVAGKPVLDVSWAIRERGSINPMYRMPSPELWQRASDLAGYEGLRCLSHIDQLLYAAAHAADHAFARFVWLADIVFIIRRRQDLLAKESELFSFAAQARAERALRLALYLAQELFGEQLGRSRPPWGTKWLARRILRHRLEWGDHLLTTTLRRLIRASLVDNALDLLRAALGIAARE